MIDEVSATFQDRAARDAHRSVWAASLLLALDDAVRCVVAYVEGKRELTITGEPTIDLRNGPMGCSYVSYVLRPSSDLFEVCSLAGIDPHSFCDGAADFIERKTGWREL